MASTPSPPGRGASGVQRDRPFAAPEDPHPPSSDTVAPPRGGADADEPSAEWGWHGSFPRLTLAAGWASAAAVFLLLIGNHTGRLEDYFLIGTGITLVVLLVSAQLRRRTSGRG